MSENKIDGKGSKITFYEKWTVSTMLWSKLLEKRVVTIRFCVLATNVETLATI